MLAGAVAVCFLMLLLTLAVYCYNNFHVQYGIVCVSVCAFDPKPVCELIIELLLKDGFCFHVP